MTGDSAADSDGTLARTFPRGHQRLYEALRDAGVPAPPLRNVPWINTAADGTIVMNVWRRHLEAHGGEIVAKLEARDWEKDRKTIQKCRAVVAGLAASHGRTIRVVILEERVPLSRKCSGARCDDAWWLVEDTAREFLLWRSRSPMERDDMIPSNPAGFGQLAQVRRARVSVQIERSPKVRRFTLERAGYQCEIPGCRDAIDFETIEVHHITRLGDGGADHTDNTAALCPACHARVHKAVASIQRRLNKSLARIRAER